MRKLALAAVVLAAAGLAGCRQDMHDQPRYKPLAFSAIWENHSSALHPPEGTVARGTLLDDYLRTGMRDGKPGTQMPYAVNREVLERGRQRYDIYCAPCHSRTGEGGGMVVLRGYQRPPSLHEQRLIDIPIGHFVDVINRGFGAMPDYAMQVKPRDRWAIAAYVRALQLTQQGTVQDVPPEARQYIQHAPDRRPASMPAPPRAPSPAAKEER